MKTLARCEWAGSMARMSVRETRGRICREENNWTHYRSVGDRRLRRCANVNDCGLRRRQDQCGSCISAVPGLHQDVSGNRRRYQQARRRGCRDHCARWSGSHRHVPAAAGGPRRCGRHGAHAGQLLRRIGAGDRRHGCSTRDADGSAGQRRCGFHGRSASETHERQASWLDRRWREVSHLQRQAVQDG